MKVKALNYAPIILFIVGVVTLSSGLGYINLYAYMHDIPEGLQWILDYSPEVLRTQMVIILFGAMMMMVGVFWYLTSSRRIR